MTDKMEPGISDSNDKMFVIIAGNIGSGKTTLTQKLAQRLEWRPHYESVADNPYLKDFYADMSRWSFPLQIYFFTTRFNAHKEMENANYSAILDRSIYEDVHIFSRALFEQGMMDKRDYDNFLALHSSMVSHLNPPTLLIYLRRSVPKLLERIRMRGREYEKSISEEYLTRLNHYYDEWFESYRIGKTLLVDTDNLDFLENEDHFDRLVTKVFDSIDQKDLFFQF